MPSIFLVVLFHFLNFLIFFSLWYEDLDVKPHGCQAGTLSPEPLYQPLFIVVCGCTVAFTKVLIIYKIYLHSPLHHSHLYHLLIPCIVSTSLIFPFTSMCTQCFHHIGHLTHFPCLLPLPLVPSSQAGPVLPYCSTIL
jgi:hypothetical protein